MLISKKKSKYFSYVGYSKDLKKRLYLHNTSKGAKYTKGKKWKLIYKKGFSTKSIALKEEYKLKNDYHLRNKLKRRYIKDAEV
tara:strand:- start:571 stop:819 length:249 start_codon:yes stop_codon:yes gene_type:complete